MLARLRALRFFAGFRPICEDNLPVIGPVPGCSKLIVASGHGRTGVRFSASTGKAVSEMIVDGQTEQAMEADRRQRQLVELQEQIKQLKLKLPETVDPLDEKPPHY